MTSPYRAIFLPALALVLGCASAPPPAPNATKPASTPASDPKAASNEAPAVALATVGGETITVADFEREMAKHGGRNPGLYATAEQRRALLDEMVRQRAVVAAARASGADRDPEFVAAVDRLLVAQYLRSELDPRVNAVEATPEEVAAYYAAHEKELSTPARVRVGWIFVEVSPKAGPEAVAKARQRIDDARAAAAKLPADSVGMGEVAQKYSDDASTRYMGGELGWLYLEQADTYRWGPDLVRAAFALPAPGALGPVTRHERGFYFLRLSAREDSMPTPIEKLRTGIRSRLLTEKRDTERDRFYADLLAGTKVAIDEKRFAAIPAPAPAAPEGAAPPALPTP